MRGRPRLLSPDDENFVVATATTRPTTNLANLAQSTRSFRSDLASPHAGYVVTAEALRSRADMPS